MTVSRAPRAPELLPGGPWMSQGGPAREGQAFPVTFLLSPLNLKHCVGFQDTVERLDSPGLRKAHVCRHTLLGGCRNPELARVRQ